MKKNIIIFVPSVDFRDEEYFDSRKLFDSVGFNVNVASTVMADCIGILNGKVKPDYLITDIDFVDWDAFIFIGGSGAISFYNDIFLQKIIQDAVSFRKIIASTSNAVIVLANAGVLRGRRVTATKNEEVLLGHKGAFFSSRRVEYDNRIITCNGYESASQFARSIIKELNLS